MLMKGTAWAQVRALSTEKLTDGENGVTVLLQAISTWEEAEEMQLYDKFEKALYRYKPSGLMRQRRALSTG